MTKTINPVSLELNTIQNDIYRFIGDRDKRGVHTTSTDLSDALGKERSWIFRNLSVLMNKALIERYNGKYYKLKGN